MIPYICDEVKLAIEDELIHQARKYGIDKQQSFPGYVAIMQRELNEATDGWFTGAEGRDSALAEIVQVVATGIACLNEYGVVGCPAATNDRALD